MNFLSTFIGFFLYMFLGIGTVIIISHSVPEQFDIYVRLILILLLISIPPFCLKYFEKVGGLIKENIFILGYIILGILCIIQYLIQYSK